MSAELKSRYFGKTKEVFELVDYGSGDALVIVASDRISASDVVLSGLEIDGKGAVLTALSQYWFSLTRDIVPNHLIGWRASELPQASRGLAGTAMLVRRLDMLPWEVVVRGHLCGSAEAEYVQHGSVGGVGVLPGLRRGERLPSPMVTFSRKVIGGPDVNVSTREAASELGDARFEEICLASLRLYNVCSAHAESRGVIIADTKFEFGTSGDSIVLGDEIITPDSSRLWVASEYSPGRIPSSLDKRYLKEWLSAAGWFGQGPVPQVPASVLVNTKRCYDAACEAITDRSARDFAIEARSR
jgi:phosphoribosylaminoimidazole-succinocarboxamide synthase